MTHAHNLRKQHATQHALKSLGTSIGKATKGIEHVVDKGIDATEKVYETGFKEVGSTIRSLGSDAKGAISSLSLPLLVGGAVVLLVLVNRR